MTLTGYSKFGIEGWHTARWWKTRLLKSGMVDIITCDTFPEGKNGNELFRKMIQIFNEEDFEFHKLAWDDFTFVRIYARRV